MKFYYLNLFILLVVSVNYLKASQPNDPIPEHDTFTIQSKQVGESRVINVWVPSDYEESSDSLPVMYMADGGIKEDFPHIANTLADLIRDNKIKPVILVGIENTQRRRDLTGFTKVRKDKKIAPVVGGSWQFRTFIKEELFPEIHKRYRTSNEKSIIGESLAGLFVIETFLLTPDMFNHYIAFDPSLWWNNHDLVNSARGYLEKFPSAKRSIWFAGSNAKDISPYTKKLATILKKANMPGIKWNYSDEPDEKHVTIFRATKEKAIIWTLN